MKRMITVLLIGTALGFAAPAGATSAAADHHAPAAVQGQAPAVETPAEAAPAPAAEKAVIGEMAPDFTLTDSNGKTHNLHDYAGKIVVLEWTNHMCPFVVRHYKSGQMQLRQKSATDRGAIWLSIVSSAPGKEGYVTGAQANAIIKQSGSHETARLLDPEGTVGKLYGATTTPNMFVIDKDGKLVYKGAVDSMPTTNAAAAANANDYVSGVVASLLTGQEIRGPQQTQPYGCAIKYAE